MAIYGGFPSGRGTWQNRDPSAYETVLSGDINITAHSDDNSYHVVTGSGTDGAAVLDGFTITGGNSGIYGGGMYNVKGNPTVSNCVFSDNLAGDRGGGMYNWSSSPTLTNCTFKDNSTIKVWSKGGGMANKSGSNPALKNCTFISNFTHWYGGGMWNWASNPTLANCVFRGNSVIYSGGAIYNEAGSKPNLVNCTLGRNKARLEQGGGLCNDDSQPTLTNCILWGNTDRHEADESAQIYNYNNATAFVNYSCIQGWAGSLGGTGNIGEDPLFEADGYHLVLSSPCINAGDPTDGYGSQNDIDGEPRVFASRVDIGADEFVPSMEVTMKFTPQALNPASHGSWVKAHFVLPEGFTVEDVNANILPRMIEPVNIQSGCIDVFVNKDDLVEIEVSFARAGFCDWAEYGSTDLTVIGLFTDGESFYGVDTIQIVGKRF